VLQQGNYGKRSERTAWLIVLAGVKGDPGVQRKIILKILRDATELDAFHPTLNIEVPLITAEGFGISWALARIWAFVIGGSGLVIVFGPMIWKSLCAIFPRIESS